jgi:hypothetical protein
VSAAAELRRLVNGYQVSQAIHAAAILGLADLLADGPRASDELAVATGTDSYALYRLLRALSSVGVFREDGERRFELTELGSPLRSDSPDSIADMVVYSGRPYYRQAWASLLDSVRTGKSAFRLVHDVDGWEYRAQRPDENAVFDRAMAAMSRMQARSLLDAYDFGRFRKIVDVGGGSGYLLKTLLAEYGELRGVLFDQPQVVAGVELGERGEVVAGSFFEAVPEGGDAYLLKSILHDWEDAEAVSILRTVRRHGPTILVLERVLGPPNEGAEEKFSDLNMLVATGGTERTREEFAALFDASGYRLVEITPSSSTMCVIEGVAV